MNTMTEHEERIAEGRRACECGHVRMTHSQDGSRCWNFTGPARLVGEGVDKLRTGTACTCEGYRPGALRMVIEWPSDGSGDWWLVEDRSSGITPIERIDRRAIHRSAMSGLRPACGVKRGNVSHSGARITCPACNEGISA